jgi:hypothetical protein
MMYCPAAAPPTVTFQGTVTHSGGTLNRGATLLHYDLQVAVYNNFTKTQATFMVRAYFKNGRRWAKFPSLIPQSRLFVVGKVCGVTVQERQLAVLVEAVFFIPKDSIANIIPPQTPQSSAKRKRQDRWGQRATFNKETQSLTPSRTQLPSKQQDGQAPASIQLPNTVNSPSPVTASLIDEATQRADHYDDEGSVDTAIPWDLTPIPASQESGLSQRPQRTRKPPRYHETLG